MRSRSLGRGRWRALVAGLSVAAVVLAGCSGSGSGGGASGSGAPSTEPLRVVIAAEPSTLNPILTVYGVLRTVGPIFDPLVGFDRATLEPNDSGLLTSWERVSPTQWRFNVRQGVTFHNGEPWDAAAAVYTIEKYRDEPKSNYAPYYKRIVDLRAESPSSILITTNVPYIAMPAVLASAVGIPPKYYSEVSGTGFSDRPVGTGPFEFASAQTGQSFTMKAYPQYWQGAPTLSGITVSWAVDSATRAALLRSGGADIVYDLPQELIGEIDGSEGLRTVTQPALYKMVVSMNSVQGTLQDLNLRKAVQAAIDYDAIVQALFGGVGARKSAFLTGDLLPKDPNLQYQKFDLEEAKRLVAASGGTPKLRYLYTTGAYLQDRQVGEAVSAMLRAAGFEVEQVPLENAELRRQRTDTSLYSLYSVVTFPVFSHPDSIVAFFTGSNASVKYCTDPAGYDQLAAAGLTTTNQAESDAIYEQIERKILDVDACNAVLYDQTFIYGMTDKVKDFVPALDGVPYLYKAKLES